MTLPEQEFNKSFKYNYEICIGFDMRKFIDLKDLFKKIDIDNFCEITEHGIDVYFYIPEFNKGVILINGIEKIFGSIIKEKI